MDGDDPRALRYAVSSKFMKGVGNVLRQRGNIPQEKYIASINDHTLQNHDTISLKWGNSHRCSEKEPVLASWPGARSADIESNCIPRTHVLSTMNTEMVTRLLQGSGH